MSSGSLGRVVTTCVENSSGKLGRGDNVEANALLAIACSEMPRQAVHPAFSQISRLTNHRVFVRARRRGDDRSAPEHHTSKICAEMDVSCVNAHGEKGKVVQHGEMVAALLCDTSIRPLRGTTSFAIA